MEIRTKIVATLGPERPIYNLDDQIGEDDINYLNMINWMVEAGVDVFRLNMSHRSKDGSRERRFLDAYRDNRYSWESRGRYVAILGDLQGPKIRLGDFFDDPQASVQLTPGASFVLHTKKNVIGNETQAVVYYEAEPFAQMSKKVKSKDRIWLGDGEALLEVQSVSASSGAIDCIVRSGATIQGRRGVTAKGVTFDLELFTAKDREDLKLLLSFGDELTYIALSFVRSAEDILKVKCQIRDEYERQGVHPDDIPIKLPGIIAKIETQDAVDNIEEILDVADGVMVARGDLGMQIGFADVASIQKRIIPMCNVRGKLVITATQMLDSMERNPIPTRAEVTDVYNAIIDGSDAVMLSGETSKGKYPLQAIRTMCTIAQKAEADYFGNTEHEERFLRLLRSAEAILPKTEERIRERISSYSGRNNRDKRYRAEYIRIDKLLQTQRSTDRISHAACSLSVGIRVAAIMAPSTSGQTTRMVARFRPVVPIIGVAHDYCVARKLTLYFGVHPVNILRNYNSSEEIFQAGSESAKRVLYREDGNGSPLVKKGDLVVITAGYPLFSPGTTNLVKLHPVK
jgi:pyruvate kinase